MITKEQWKEKLDKLVEWRKGAYTESALQEKINRVINILNPHYSPDEVFNFQSFKGKVLDIGCGSGRGLSFPNAEYKGIDPLIDNTTGENQQEQDNSYDNIVSISVLHSCFDYEIFLLNSKRVLKENGRIYLTIVCRESDEDGETSTYNLDFNEWLSILKRYFKSIHWFYKNKVLYFIGEK